MKVLIVRIFPRQFEWLKNAYSGPHKLDFVDDESLQQVKTKVGSADKVVAITKFMSHSHWDFIPKHKVVHVDSVNLDKVLHVLDTLPEDEVAKPKPSDAVKPVVSKTHLIKRLPEMSTSTTREVGGFVLTTAVPMPGSKESKPAWPFDDMKVGESFFVDAPNGTKHKVASRIAANYAYYRKKHPNKVFRTKVSEDGVRCWRMPDKKAAKN